MSLKAFHFVFIILSTLLCFGFAAWSYQNYQVGHQFADIMLAIIAGLGGIALIIYGIFFVRKTRKIN